MAKQANGSVVVSSGDNKVLVTVVAEKESKNLGFLPLTIEYQERMYAAGRIPGSYFRREIGRPSEKEVLTCRIIDRPLRPLFPKGYSQRNPADRHRLFGRPGDRPRCPGHERRLHRPDDLRHPLCRTGGRCPGGLCRRPVRAQSEQEPAGRIDRST